MSERDPDKADYGEVRRAALYVAAGMLGAVAGGVAAAVYFGTTRKKSVPGFAWTARPGFNSDYLSIDDAAFSPGDQRASTPFPALWKRGNIIGTPLYPLLDAWKDRPDARLGMLYTNPKGKWRDGWGHEGQFYGGVVMHEDEPMLAAAMRIGRWPVHFSWALSGPDGSREVGLQLQSVLLDEVALRRVPKGIPLL